MPVIVYAGVPRPRLLRLPVLRRTATAPRLSLPSSCSGCPRIAPRLALSPRCELQPACVVGSSAQRGLPSLAPLLNETSGGWNTSSTKHKGRQQRPSQHRQGDADRQMSYTHDTMPMHPHRAHSRLPHSRSNPLDRSVMAAAASSTAGPVPAWTLVPASVALLPQIAEMERLSYPADEVSAPTPVLSDSTPALVAVCNSASTLVARCSLPYLRCSAPVWALS